MPTKLYLQKCSRWAGFYLCALVFQPLPDAGKQTQSNWIPYISLISESGHISGPLKVFYEWQHLKIL